MNINGKNIILTGASSGIGLEVLKLLSEYKDTRIIAVARNVDDIPIVKDNIFAYSADISHCHEIDKLFNFALSKIGSVDIFIANAGFAYMERLSVPNWNHNKKIFEVNTLSPIYSLEKLGAQNNAQEKFFVCVSSAVSQVILPYYSLYCASKSAIHYFLEAYRYEADSNMRIACVYPIATRTSFFEKANTTVIPFLSQDATTVAKSIVKGIQKNKQKIYPSTLFRIFKNAGRIFPVLLAIYSRREKRKIDCKNLL